MKSVSDTSSPSPCLLGENSIQQINSKVLTGKEILESKSLPKLFEPTKCESESISKLDNTLHYLQIVHM